MVTILKQLVSKQTAEDNAKNQEKSMGQGEKGKEPVNGELTIV